MDELAAQRRAELAAARRVPARRLGGGALSGPLPWLQARGAYLIDELDRPVTLRGAAATWLERAEPTGDAFEPAVDERDLAMLQAWGANAVAVPIAQDLALSGGGGATQVAYLEALDRTVAAAAEAGLYTVLRLSLLSSQLPTNVDAQGRDRFDPALPNLRSVDLWGLLARRYAAEPAVLFDLFRSPHDPGPGDATGAIVPRVGWPLWRRWLLAMLGEVRRGHPRALVILRGTARGRDLSEFPMTYTDGSQPANLLFGAELVGAEPVEALRGLARLARDHPVIIASWWAGPDDAAAVQAQGRRLARAGWHWLAAGWNGWEMPLVETVRGGLRPTALGRAFQVALAQPAAPAANFDLAVAGGRGGPSLATPDTKILSGPQRPRRDPFAPPGMPGNRWASYGQDGPIPAGYRKRVDEALDLAYKLAFQPQFTATFARVIGVLTGKRVGPELYLDTLDRLVLHLADTTRHPTIRKALQRDEEGVRIDPSYQPPPAYSIPNGPNVWIKEFQLRQSSRVLAGTILHEAAHAAGAPADQLAEIAIEVIHNAGYPRR